MNTDLDTKQGVLIIYSYILFLTLCLYRSVGDVLLETCMVGPHIHQLGHRV